MWLILADHPSEVTARNLTLAAKVLQNLANFAPFGAKEAFMIPCNEYLSSMKGKIIAYFDAISVGFPFFVVHFIIPRTQNWAPLPRSRSWMVREPWQVFIDTAKPTKRFGSPLHSVLLLILPEGDQGFVRKISLCILRHSFD
jgi:hypothetical protein